MPLSDQIARIAAEILNLKSKQCGACTCKGPCTGYQTKSNCPPLIVIATLALSEGAAPRTA